MDKDTFHIAEYESLREEIRDSKARIFEISTVNLIGIPLASAIFEKNLIPTKEIAFGVPFFVIAAAFLAVIENNYMMRCGRYIKENIEVSLHCRGWECWLETRTGARNAEKLFKTTFICLYVLFYVSISLIAIQANAGVCLWQCLGEYKWLATLMAYLAVGAVAFTYLANHMEWKTTKETRKAH